MMKTEPAFLQNWINELSTPERLDAGVLKSILKKYTPSLEDLSTWAASLFLRSISTEATIIEEYPPKVPGFSR